MFTISAEARPVPSSIAKRESLMRAADKVLQVPPLSPANITHLNDWMSWLYRVWSRLIDAFTC